MLRVYQTRTENLLELLRSVARFLIAVGGRFSHGLDAVRAVVKVASDGWTMQNVQLVCLGQVLAAKGAFRHVEGAIEHILIAAYVRTMDGVVEIRGCTSDWILAKIFLLKRSMHTLVVVFTA